MGGPLDAAGAWILDPERPTAGVIPFAVEVKNVRGTLYPWHRETWDLLGKLGDFPAVVPVLVARRMHYTTFTLFSDIGALGFASRRQWFSDTIDADRFDRVTARFGFRDAVQATSPDAPYPALVRFFNTTAYKEVAGQPLMARQAKKWAVAAPIAARFSDLRENLAPDLRRDRWQSFCDEVINADLYDRGGWAPHQISP